MRLPELNERVVVLHDGQRLFSRIAEVRKPDLVAIAPPSDDHGRVVELEERAPVAIEWTCARGLARGSGIVARLDEVPVPVAFVRIDSAPIVQRRDHVRIESLIEVEITQAASVPVRTTTIDLSGGGMRAVVPLYLDVGEHVKVVLELPEQEPLEAVARVIRGSEAAGYAFGWVEIDPAEHERLIRFVFTTHSRGFSYVRRPA